MKDNTQKDTDPDCGLPREKKDVIEDVTSEEKQDFSIRLKYILLSIYVIIIGAFLIYYLQYAFIDDSIF